VIVAARSDADEVRTLYEVTNRFWDAYRLHEPTVDAGRRANNHRDAAAHVLGYQIAELGCAAADEFNHPRPTAGAVVGRALMEAVLTLRWCLKSENHAQRWWLDGDAAIQKLARQTGLADDPLSEALRKEKVRKPTVPGMQSIAHEVGCDRLYELFYHLLSQYAHGVRSAAHHMFVSAKSDAAAVPLPIRPVIFLVGDAGSVYEAVKRVLAPPPALPPKRFG
jgi:hypothetical protein